MRLSKRASTSRRKPLPAIAKIADASSKEYRALAEQHAATVEILRVIARSPSDAQPVFDTIVRSAQRLLCGYSATVTRVIDGALHLAAWTTTSRTADAALKKLFPMRVSGSGNIAKAARSGVPAFVVDTEVESPPASRRVARARGFRAVLSVPMVRKKTVLGVITVTRREPGAFSKRDIGLLQTFAEQAVIAIENARLFNETKEALERETATSEILRIIAGSPGEVQPVFDAIVAAAARLFGRWASLRLVEAGGLRRKAPRIFAANPPNPEVLPIDRDSLVGRVALEAKPMQVTDTEAPDAPPFALARIGKLGYRAIAAAPLMRSGTVLGVIAVTTQKPGALSDKQLAVLQTFADQAVIAIENARLFNETKEALERQTATAEILKVISSSPTDVQPVFDAIVVAAQRLIGGKRAGLLVRRETDFEVAASSEKGVIERLPDEVRVVPLDRARNFPSRAILDGEVVHVPNWEADEVPEFEKLIARTYGIRSGVIVPLLRQGQGIGALAVTRPAPGAYHEKEIELLRSFADQAVIAIENARLFNETKESLEHQTAIARILGVMSSSPADVRPVLDAVAESAARLCETDDAVILRIEPDGLRRVAHFGSLPVTAEGEVQPIGAGTVDGRAVLECRAIYIADTEEEFRDESYAEARAMWAAAGKYRTMLAMPLIREGTAIGVILCRRREKRAFTYRQITLLQTFADQAVIAIENVRLFNETKEALERQTATAEILKVISSSPTDVQPVFDAIIRSAVQLCGGMLGNLQRFDGKVVHLVAHHNLPPEGLQAYRRVFPRPLGRDTVAGCAMLDRAVINLPDALDDAVPPHSRELAKETGFRSVLVVPLLHKGEPIGVISVARAQPGPFASTHVEILKTFADQAVIAIENARLFNETREALAWQTATSDVLRVIAGTPTDTQPVFEAIVQSAVRLCRGQYCIVFSVEGDQLRLAAHYGVSAVGVEELARRYPAPLTASFNSARCARSQAVIQLCDAQSNPAISEAQRRLARIEGYQSQLFVPMLQEGRCRGVIALTKPENEPFPDAQVALVRTFADQAVIAIENVRLFRETREALEQQQASADILRTVSTSVADSQPAFDAILAAVRRLFDGFDATVWRVEQDKLVAVARGGPTTDRSVGHAVPITPDYVHGVAVLERRPVRVDDVAASPEISEVSRHDLLSRNRGAVLLVPFVRDGDCVGAISVSRTDPYRFSEKQVSLLESFASQAVIAIENTRLFNETKDALERQTATSEILRVIAGTPTDAQPVFDAIVQSAQRLMSANSAALLLRRETEFFLAAYSMPNAESLPAEVRTAPLDPSKNYPSQVMLECKTVHVPDWEADEVPEFERFVAKAYGIKSGLQVPLVRKGEGIGSLAVTRQTKGTYSDKEIALLQSFADQAVIAIENVRLFNETKEALEQQTATSSVLSVISRSPTDLQPVFDAILAKATELCEAHMGLLHLYDGEKFRTVAHRGNNPEYAKYTFERGSFAPNAFLLELVRTLKPLHLADIRDSSHYREGRQNAVKMADIAGARTFVAVPLLKEGRLTGTLSIYRPQVRPFTDKQIALVQTFADQAAIAIENVRLFNETREALEQQTATAEILKVISASPTSTQPVFEAIVQSAARLFAPCTVSIVMREGALLMRKARAGPELPMDQAALANIWPLPFDPERSMAARSIIERRIIEIPDTEAPGMPAVVSSLGKAAGYRAITLVPLVREGEGIGVIALTRPEPDFKFTEKQLALVRTFADQAVIAIENVRLFNETKESLEQRTATAEVLSVISGSITDARPVFEAISRAVLRLYGARHVGLFVRAGDLIDRVGYAVADGSTDDGSQALWPMPLDDKSLTGRTILSGEMVHIRELQAEAGLSEGSREFHRITEVRSVLLAPMQSMGVTLGALSVARRSPGGFSEREVELIRTFADQAVIAMENVRLFREIEEKSRQLEAASQHKSQFLASMSHELRTPLNAILGFNEMILDGIYGELHDDVRAPLENIQTSGKHLLRLINNVLDLAKIEAGRMELALSEYSVQDTVASVHSTLKPLAAEKGLEFVAEVPSDIPLARGDSGRIAQCLMNLAGNSLKFTKAGRVAIAVAQDNGLLRFNVADTGIGIPADKIPHLFTEFKQTDATVASEYGGTGLGLSITKKFIEMHGGRIWVESEPGKGSSFRFEIPLRVAR